MIGSQIKSNHTNLLIEYTHFSGTEKEILFMLNALLKNMLKNVKFCLIQFDNKLKDSQLESLIQLNKYDDCITVFDIINHELLFKTISKNKKAKFKKAFPLRNVILNKKIRALLFVEETTDENNTLLELISNISSMKLEISSIFTKTREISKYYNFGKVAPQIFHEIKNKLIAPYTFLQSFRSKINDKNFINDFSELALQELKTIQYQIENSLQHGKDLKEQSYKKNISFKNIISRVISLIEPRLQKGNIKIIEKIDSNQEFPIPFYLLKDVLLNLLFNSIDALESSKDKKHIIIKTFTLKNYFGFSIEDNGSGINDKHLPHLFESFYTTKSTGTGLGLTIVKEEVEKYKGSVEVKSKLGNGTKISIKFQQN